MTQARKGSQCGRVAVGKARPGRARAGRAGHYGMAAEVPVTAKGTQGTSDVLGVAVMPTPRNRRDSRRSSSNPKCQLQGQTSLLSSSSRFLSSLNRGLES